MTAVCLVRNLGVQWQFRISHHPLAALWLTSYLRQGISMETTALTAAGRFWATVRHVRRVCRVTVRRGTPGGRFVLACRHIVVVVGRAWDVGTVLLAHEYGHCLAGRDEVGAWSIGLAGLPVWVPRPVVVRTVHRCLATYGMSRAEVRLLLAGWLPCLLRREDAA